MTCCFFALLKTLLITTKATALRRNQRPRASFSLAGFEVTLIGRFWVTPEVVDPTSAPAAANQCLPVASITVLASAPPSRSPLAAVQNVRAPAAWRTNTRRLHNAPFHYVVDKSRTVWTEDGTVGEDLPSRTRSSRRLASSLSRACLFNTHGPQAIGRSAAI